MILGYADDIDMMERTFEAMSDVFLNLQWEAGRMGIIIDETKTKYMTTAPIDDGGEPYVRIERIEEFIYLGSQVNSENKVEQEIWSRIVSANRCYYGLAGHFKSRTLFWTTKIQLYKTLVRPVLTYAAECWSTTRSQEQSL